MLKPAILSLAALLSFTACATAPTGPSVMVLPGTGKPLELFQADDAACRAWATQNVGSDPVYPEAQRRYDVAYQQCMYAKGNQIPGMRAATPYRYLPPPPPGTQPPPPSSQLPPATPSPGAAPPR